MDWAVQFGEGFAAGMVLGTVIVLAIVATHWMIK